MKCPAKQECSKHTQEHNKTLIRNFLNEEKKSHLLSLDWNIGLHGYCSSVGKVSACSAGDLGLIPGLGRSPGEGNGYPFQYSCLENPRDRGFWWAIVHRVARVRQADLIFLSLTR